MRIHQVQHLRQHGIRVGALDLEDWILLIQAHLGITPVVARRDARAPLPVRYHLIASDDGLLALFIPPNAQTHCDLGDALPHILQGVVHLPDAVVPNLPFLKRLGNQFRDLALSKFEPYLDLDLLLRVATVDEVQEASQVNGFTALQGAIGVDVLPLQDFTHVLKRLQHAALAGTVGAEQQGDWPELDADFL